MLPLYLLWGILLSFNDLVSVALRQEFHLTYRSAVTGQSTFFAVCFLSAPLVAHRIETRGYRRTIVEGVAIMSTASCVMAVAAAAISRPLFIFGSGLLGLGANLLQTAGAVYVTRLGSPGLATRRFSFALGFNSLGTAIGPLVASLWFVDHSTLARGGSIRPTFILASYLALAIALAAMALWFVRLGPRARNDDTIIKSTVPKDSVRALLRSTRLLFGAGVILLYAGVEVGLGALLVPLLLSVDGQRLSLASASRLVAFYWGGAMAGRFLFVPLLGNRRDRIMLIAATLIAASLLGLSLSMISTPAGFLVLGIGLCHSVIVPIVYDFSIRDLGPLTAPGASLISAMVVGAAFVPKLLAHVADRGGLRLALFLLLPCYAVIGLYAFAYPRLTAPFSAK